MKFKVENKGKGSRYVPTLAGRSVVDPGEKNARKLDMDPEIARQYLAMAKRSEKFTIQITALDAQGSAELEKPLQPRQRGRMPPDQQPQRRQSQPPQQVAPSPYNDIADLNLEEDAEVVEEESEDDKAAAAKKELLFRADEMELGDLRTEASMLLKKNLSNKLSRDKVKALLAE